MSETPTQRREKCVEANAKSIPDRIIALMTSQFDSIRDLLKPINVQTFDIYKLTEGLYNPDFFIMEIHLSSHPPS